jgi:cytidylate kinase
MAIITITRGLQAGGRELARLLTDRLGYKRLSREVITGCARKYNILEEDLYNTLVEAPSRWQRLSKKQFRYLIFVQCALIDAARQDNVIYHGYAGQLFLRGVRHALKIRLEAPLEERVSAVMKDSGRAYEDALRHVEAADELRRRWWHLLHNADWHDPRFYDVSFNLHNMTLETVCDIVELLLQRKEFQTTEESLAGLERLSLESEVRAAIAADDSIWDQPVDVSAEGSVITLRGIVKNNKAKKAIVDVASRVKGVTDCKVYLTLPESG